MNYKKKWGRLLSKQGLVFDGVVEVDLRECYLFQTPDKSVDHLMFSRGNRDNKLTNSPHTELAYCYFEYGREWVVKYYQHTRYCYMREHYLGKPVGGQPSGSMSCFQSIKDYGYLGSKYSDCYILMIFDISYCNSRYGMSESNDLPQIFAGHHRAAALIALGQYIVQVMAIKNEKGMVNEKHYGSGVTPREREKLNFSRKHR